MTLGIGAVGLILVIAATFLAGVCLVPWKRRGGPPPDADDTP